MFSNILAASNNVTMIIILVVLMVGMLVMSIVPQRKRQKETQKMMESLKVGSKIKTIGGFVGEIISIDNATNTLVIDVSPNLDKSSCAVIDKGAVYTVMQTNDQGQVVPQEPQVEIAKDDVPVAPVAKDDVVEDKEESSSEETTKETK